MTDSESGFYIESEKLPTFGESTARRLKISGAAPAKRLLRELHDALAALRRIRETLERGGNSEAETSEAAHWLLDNGYLAEREGLSAALDLRASAALRAVGDSLLISEACGALVRSGAGEVTEERCEAFLAGFQRVAPLSRAELALLAACLRCALVIELAAVCRELPGDASRVAHIFTSLRLLATLDLSALLDRVDLTEQILRRDPAGVYPLMDERSRDMYRRRVTKLAERAGVGEQKLAARLIADAESAEGDARHVGYHLFIKPLGREKSERGGGGYIALLLLPTLFISLLLGFATDSLLAAFLLLLPVSELVKSLVDLIVLKSVPPRILPRMELAEGVPPEGRCVCVVSSLLTSPEGGAALARRLEEFHLASRDCGKNLVFGILGDLPEAETETLPSDAPALRAAAEAVGTLNKKYGGGFYLFCRRRSFDAKNARWAGSERKRGAVLALARLLHGEESELTVLCGDASLLAGGSYILTLDADTRLAPGAAKELIGAMLHPLNRPVVDRRRRVVTRGHGIIQPRIGVELASAEKSDFARIFAGQGGSDPYGSSCGEVYMDLFGRGGFAGKGIIDAAALLACTDWLPCGLILSHDAVEGALLRGGCMSDTELCDGFPASPLAYWRRLQRWTRGDWQNISFLFKRGRELSDTDRWKLLDSLRRSLLPPMSFIAILAGFFSPESGLAVAAAVALLSLCTNLALSLGESVASGGRRLRLYSAVPRGFAAALIRTALRLILLPCEAWVCGSAIVTALWRMGVSRKNLLAWQTSAQSEAAARGGALAHYSAMWLCPAAGLAALLFAPAIIGRAAGVIWLFAPLCAMALGKERKPERPLPEEEREYLLARAAEIWRYFETFCRPADNFLPPDNWQEQPPVGAAHRTSPTNIGFALVSALAALDLSLCERDAALALIARLLDAIERLPKWKGHLYNWYDTQKLQSLEPTYVSTVDSGNLAASLIALREGLAEYGEAELSARAGALFAAMDFAPLYDPTRRLFRIGYDISAGAFSNGWYDLMSSEARLTGYIAVAKGDAPRRHWRQLSRALVSKDGFRGMASWTGTMFEYLMPELFLPLRRDSLLWESAKFCMFVQRGRPPKGLPWGISESAFYSLDPSLAYRYKAHGCAALALKRGMDDELVISPYSSFLALAVEPRRAVANLKSLEKLGALGCYGFWEAIDFTPSRCGSDGGETVRCVMSHHLGMSLVAIDNCLKDGAMRTRFMRDPAMSAHRGLLEEKTPIGAVVLRRRGAEPPDKPLRVAAEGWERRGEGVDFERPECCLLSNGVYNVMLTESGLSSASAGGVGVYAGPHSALTGPLGLELYLETAVGQIPLLPRRGMEERRFSWAFSGGSALFESSGGGVSARVVAAVSARDCGETRLIELSAAELSEGTLCLDFTPTLSRHSDYVNHPAFWRLGLFAKARAGALLLRRLPRGDNAGAWLCLAADKPMDFSANADGEPLGWLSYPIIRTKIAVSFPSALRLAIAFGGEEDDAYAAAQRILALVPADFADLGSAGAAQLRMSPHDSAEAMAMASALVFPRPSGAVTEGRDALWRFGISGDLPIICSELTCGDRLPAAAELLRRHALLTLCGLKSDLVFLSAEGGDYRRHLSRSVSDALTSLGLDSHIGAPGGVHIADATTGGEAVSRCAALNLRLGEPNEPRPRRDGERIAPRPAPRQGGDVEYKWLDDDSFEFYVNQFLPRRAWSVVLANDSLGFIASDAGTGNMWYRNARECRLSPWLCDPLAASGPETLEVSVNGVRTSLFAAEDGIPCRVTFGLGWAEWEKELPSGSVRVTAFVPPDTAARVLLIEGAGAEIFWKTDLCLCGEQRDAGFVVTDYVNQTLSARSSRSPWPDVEFTALFSAAPTGITCDLGAWLTGRLDGAVGAGLLPCFGVVLPQEKAQVIVCGCAESPALRALAEPEAARAALEDTKNYWRGIAGRLRVTTPDEALNRYLNGWAVYQTVACRLMGRSSLYQSGGAYGFRDQLQDGVNLLLISDAYARRRILDACAHQYPEGDVMHWWHPDGDTCHGVRTRCSDDLLWLPWACCEYTDATGDLALLADEIPYVVSPLLRDDEKSRYETPGISENRESVLTHATLALTLVSERGAGAHGLLLMGDGDWNDGMDKVGAGGSGESVWLTWFFSHTARRFALLLETCGRKNDAAALLSAAMRFGRAADRAWDGSWYLRGYYDDGSPLGSKSSVGCKIDSVAQSWACLCAESSPKKRAAALDSALDLLFDREHGVIKLFDPAFEAAGENPGYIKSYGPGFRENGGQYTHGAIWLALACLREGRTDDGFAILSALLKRHGGAEPFVLPADVYANADRYGEDGWSWYTGSAGWFFRVAASELLGLRRRDGELSVAPRLPSDWEGFGAVWTDAAGRERHISAARDGTVANDGDVNK
ncbi:MAG: glucoamylase family protein [Oscillospiraceae bacterium]